MLTMGVAVRDRDGKMVLLTGNPNGNTSAGIVFPRLKMPKFFPKMEVKTPL